jgi:eukaryotic-like serine/threonine-protein kinase
VSNTDEPDKKPPPPPTVAWDPADVPGLDGEAATPPAPPSAPPPADSNATVLFTAEEVEKLTEEAVALEEAAAEEDPLIGTLIRDKWKVLKRLGAGSFGTVYKVEDVKGGWIEALKILGVDRLTGAEAEEMRARFLREAQIMKRLGKDSKHIVGLATYEEDIEAGLIYFLMEFVEGKSLADELNDDGPFSVDRTIHLALQVCDALMAAHEGPQPVVHRDLKLENLMLTTDRSGAEMVKVLDFGIAKIAEREADSRLTTVGTLGTPGYAAPEQLRAEDVDGRTDLFAFGVILYALLTGRDPWLGNLAHEPTHQIYELMVATDRAEVRPIAETGVSIPPVMVNVVMKLLRRDPAQRFQSARELSDALQLLAQGGAGSDMSSLQVLTEEPGVHVEIREGRNVVTDGPTPCTADGIPPGTYSIAVRDSRYEPSQTTVLLGAGTMEDVTLVTEKRATSTRPKPGPRTKSRGAGRLVTALIGVIALGAAAYAQPWGRTLDDDTFWKLVDRASISSVWLTDGGIEGGIQVAPIAALETILTPFHLPVPEGEMAAMVVRLRNTGVSVDTSWEVRRLTDLAVEAQSRSRYFDLEGGDVASYALRIAELEPVSQEAASLLRKVGERMAWDADAALQGGTRESAEELVRRCLELVPDHPRCLEVSESL